MHFHKKYKISRKIQYLNFGLEKQCFDKIKMNYLTLNLSFFAVDVSIYASVIWERNMFGMGHFRPNL